jgi:hypothetical protein
MYKKKYLKYKTKYLEHKTKYLEYNKTGGASAWNISILPSVSDLEKEYDFEREYESEKQSQLEKKFDEREFDEKILYKLHYRNIDNIKKNINEYDITDLIDNTNTKLKYFQNIGQFNHDLKTYIVPLHYLFDEDLDEEVPSSNHMHSILNHFKIYNIFKIDKNNIIELITSEHSTHFYIFNFLNTNTNTTNTYFYYSNSGFGMNDNNIIVNDKYKYVASKLFKVIKTENNLDISFYINFIKNLVIYIYNDFIDISINILKNINFSSFDYVNSIMKKKMNIFFKRYLSLPPSLLNLQTQMIKLFTDMINPDCPYNYKKLLTISVNSFCQLLVYALIYYLCSYDYKNIHKDIHIAECTIFDILNNKDLDSSNNFNKYIINNTNNNIFNLTELTYNAYYYNDHISNTIYSELPEVEDIVLVSYISHINKTLFNISSKYPTIKYMLKRLYIKYDKKIGIVNLKQSAGSCSLYSYYFIITNMLLLSLIKKKSNSLDYNDINAVSFKYI